MSVFRFIKKIWCWILVYYRKRNYKSSKIIPIKKISRWDSNSILSSAKLHHYPLGHPRILIWVPTAKFDFSGFFFIQSPGFLVLFYILYFPTSRSELFEKWIYKLAISTNITIFTINNLSGWTRGIPYQLLQCATFPVGTYSVRKFGQQNHFSYCRESECECGNVSSPIPCRIKYYPSFQAYYIDFHRF